LPGSNQDFGITQPGKLSVLHRKRALFWSALFVFQLVTGSGAATAEGADGVAVVSYVVDGDTVILESGRKVRLIGINAPEQETGQNSAERYALEARLALSELVENIEVKVITGVEKYDRYGRTLAYLELRDGTDIQENLIARGYAVVIAYPPNIARVDRYLKVETRARLQNAGIWGSRERFIDLEQADPVISSGFKIVRARITGLKKSSYGLHFKLGAHLDLSINHGAWKEYWIDQLPEKLVGRNIETRGWVSKRKSNYGMTVRHPSMITFR
jgi:endonuclease YncB( thermonuclease family)